MKQAAAIQTKTNLITSEDFCVLYSLYNKDMYRFAYFYLKNSDDAQDAVQDAVLQAYKSIGSLKDPNAFKTWIFTILLRCCKHKIPDIIKMRNQTDIDTYKGLSNAEDADLSSDLQQAINSLNKRERAMIYLSVTAGYKSREIAQIMKFPEGTVRSTLSRAFEKLRNKIDL